MKTNKSFSLSLDALNQIEELSRTMEISASEAIEKLVLDYGPVMLDEHNMDKEVR